MSYPSPGLIEFVTAVDGWLDEHPPEPGESNEHYAARAFEAGWEFARRQPPPSPGLTWTSEPPTREGYYWRRQKGGFRTIDPVTRYDIEIRGQTWAGWHESKWAGPIPEPQEPAADAGGGASNGS